MKIYFENGELSSIPRGLPKSYVLCDARYGYSSNKYTLDLINEMCPNSNVYTNSLVALSNTYAWNKELNRPNIFMRENRKSEFKNIEELSHGKIRYAQNIESMYKGGCFGCL